MHGKRTQQKSVDEAEDGGISADADCEYQTRVRAKTGFRDASRKPRREWLTISDGIRVRFILLHLVVEARWF